MLLSTCPDGNDDELLRTGFQLHHHHQQQQQQQLHQSSEKDHFYRGKRKKDSPTFDDDRDLLGRWPPVGLHPPSHQRRPPGAKRIRLDYDDGIMSDVVPAGGLFPADPATYQQEQQQQQGFGHCNSDLAQLLMNEPIDLDPVPPSMASDLGDFPELPGFPDFFGFPALSSVPQLQQPQLQQPQLQQPQLQQPQVQQPEELFQPQQVKEEDEDSGNGSDLDNGPVAAKSSGGAFVGTNFGGFGGTRVNDLVVSNGPNHLPTFDIYEPSLSCNIQGGGPDLAAMARLADMLGGGHHGGALEDHRNNNDDDLVTIGDILGMDDLDNLADVVDENILYSVDTANVGDGDGDVVDHDVDALDDGEDGYQISDEDVKLAIRAAADLIKKDPFLSETAGSNGDGDRRYRRVSVSLTEYVGTVKSGNCVQYTTTFQGPAHPATPPQAAGANSMLVDTPTNSMSECEESDEEEMSVTNLSLVTNQYVVADGSCKLQHQPQQPQPLLKPSAAGKALAFASSMLKSKQNFQSLNRGIKIEPGCSLLRSNNLQTKPKKQQGCRSSAAKENSDDNTARKKATAKAARLAAAAAAKAAADEALVRHNLHGVQFDHPYHLTAQPPGSLLIGTPEGDGLRQQKRAGRPASRNQRPPTVLGLMTPADSGDEEAFKVKREEALHGGGDLNNLDNDLDDGVWEAADLQGHRQGCGGAAADEDDEDYKFKFLMRFRSNSPPNNQQQQQGFGGCGQVPTTVQSQLQSKATVTTGAGRSLLAVNQNNNNNRAGGKIVRVVGDGGLGLQHQERVGLQSNGSGDDADPSSSKGPSGAKARGCPYLKPTEAKRVGGGRRKSAAGTMSEERGHCSSEEEQQKSRDWIRDQHNSMERQRRVDLRNNLDNLRLRVPDIKGNEKASKLNILNKSTEYCKYLGGIDAKLRREEEQELGRNAALRARLEALRQQLDNGTRLSSGRISVVNHRRYRF